MNYRELSLPGVPEKSSGQEDHSDDHDNTAHRDVTFQFSSHTNKDVVVQAS